MFMPRPLSKMILSELEVLLEQSDIIIVASPHEEYKQIEKQKYSSKTY